MDGDDGARQRTGCIVQRKVYNFRPGANRNHDAVVLGFFGLLLLLFLISFWVRRAT